MTYPSELIEKARYEMSIFERVSAETGQALIDEVVKLREQLAAAQASKEASELAEAPALAAGSELDLIWWIQGAQRLMRAMAGVKGSAFGLALADEGDMWLRLLAPPWQLPEKIKSVPPGFKGFFAKEAQAYKQGWNECRGAMLQNLHPPVLPQAFSQWMRRAQSLMRSTEQAGWIDIANMAETWLAKEAAR